MPAWHPDACWHETYSAKKDIFTSTYLIPVGGQADDPTAGELQIRPRDKSTVEPVFFHALPASFYEEIIDGFGLTAILDLTPGSGEAAFTAYAKKVTYFGVCLGAEPLKRLMVYVEATILKAMATDSSDLYEPRLATALNGNTADSEKPKPTPKPKPKADTGNGKRKKGTSGAAPAKPKGTHKRHKKKADDKEGGDKEQPEDDDDDDDDDDDPPLSGDDDGIESQDQ